MINTIEIENLTKKFGNLTAVDNLTLNIADGEIFGLLGPNGAGKTTTMRILCCLISKTSGTAKINGLDIDNVKDQPKIRGMIGILPENVGLYENISAYKNLDFYARLYKVSSTERPQRIEALLKKLGLWGKKDTLAGTFSKGMKQKLAIGRALVHDPNILFFDEPTVNLDPEATKMIRETILELKKEKRTIFINTHMLDEAEKICNRVGILKTKLITIGSPQKLRESFGGQKTIIQLEHITDAIVNALKNTIKNVEIEGNKLILSVDNPEIENPEIVSLILAQGGRIQLMNEVSSTLEDVYLKMVREG